MNFQRERPRRVRVGTSTHGLGVFAVSRFAAEEIIGPVTGDVIDDAEYESDYCMDLGKNLSLEPASPFRYVNHSCVPNCELFQYEPEDGEEQRELWLQALRDIPADEELTIDYAWPAESAIPCGCGSEGCRGWIVDPAEAEQLPGLPRPDSETE